eukprot:TRINITY_DN22493_c0_g1_i1.p1 TRINITY_DN22493_c0_g1~~TRINITY_DN22493_c0_g1_i1.p1  ORF type:complete len:436 (+),score=223.89 TRINITY_DN22493_c0_g1_i1:54-1310(+)
MEAFTGAQLLIQPEAESIVKSLEPFPIAEVGTRRWQSQRKKVEQLNCQAHHNTAAVGGNKGQDFVVEAILAHDKVSILIHELLVIETWRRKVYPQIRDDIVKKNPAALYSLMYYEGILVNLLELVMWTEEGVARADDDLLELLDYLWRNVVTLNTYADADFWPVPMTEVADINDEKHKADSERRQQFIICMTSISLLWYIVDKVKVLPMSALNNILKKNDMPVGLTNLLDHRPWIRRGAKGMEKFITKEWRAVKGADVMVVCEYEAHTWFLIHTLLTNPECREKYTYTTWRKEQIMKARKFLNEVLVDQIPPLGDVQRALDELSFLDPPASVDEKFKTTLVIEPVARLMNSIVKGTNFKTLAGEHRARLTDPKVVMEQASEMSAMIDQIMGMGGEDGEGPSEEEMKALLAGLQEMQNQ